MQFLFYYKPWRPARNLPFEEHSCDLLVFIHYWGGSAFFFFFRAVKTSRVRIYDCPIARHMSYKIKVQYSSFSKDGSIQPLFSGAKSHHRIDQGKKSKESITACLSPRLCELGSGPAITGAFLPYF